MPWGQQRKDEFPGDPLPPGVDDRGEVESPVGQRHLDGQADHVGEVHTWFEDRAGTPVGRDSRPRGRRQAREGDCGAVTAAAEELIVGFIG
jgi:hypothetical protein